jgi:hypothetical protein
MESESLQPLLQAMKESAKKQIEQPQSNAHATIRALLVKALNDPTIFCGFDDMKQAIQSALLSSSSTTIDTNTVLLSTLDLFSYGVYQDYHNAAPGTTYLVLTDAQVFKLRQLTILTLVQQQATSSIHSSNSVSYQSLAEHLGFLNPMADGTNPANDDNVGQAAVLSSAFRQVEEVIIACLYAGILSGRLCQKTKSLIVGGSSTAGETAVVVVQSRDVPLSKVPLLWHQYDHLYRTLQNCSLQLERQATRVQKIRNDQDQYWTGVEERKKSSANSSSASRPGSSGGGSSHFQGAMSAFSQPFGFSSFDEEGIIMSANPSEPAAAARPSSSRRQSKRSRGGFGSSSAQ